jgi:hypothetical protein
MIRTCVLALSAAALLAPAARAQDDAKAVVEKAIKAHGGAANLDKFKAGKGKLKGTILIMGQEIEVAGDMSFMYPDKGKAVLTLSVQGMKINITQLIAGDRVEVVVQGMKQPIPDEQAADVRMSQYVAYLTQLTPLLRGDQFTLKSLGESKLEGKTLVGVSVTNKDKKFKEVKLYFDKDSGLLTKADHMTTDEGGKEVVTEQIFGDFKEFKGIKVATKETVIKDGKKSQELVTESFEPLEKLDDKAFTVED